MMSLQTRPWDGTRGVVGRGVLAGGAIGTTIGGVAGTAEWPVVGTFFMAIAGAVAGVLTGAFVGVALFVTVRSTTRPLTERIVGSAAAAAFVVIAHVVRLGPTTGQLGWTVASLVLIVVTGLAAPMIAHGLPAASLRGKSLPDALRWTVAVGAGIGASVGAVVGLVIGLVTYLPTALAAVVEGAVLGGGSGCVLSLIVCAGIVTKSSVARTRETR